MSPVDKVRTTVLAVDDSQTIQVALRRLLLPHGYDVVIANSGSEALEIMRRQEVDVVILDLLMPEMNGRQTLHVMRSDPDLRMIPVLLATSVADRRELVSCLDAGADDFVVKPWDERELLGRLRVLVRLKRALDAVRKERDAATSATTAKTEVLSGISHQLRGPLNTLLGFTRKLLDRVRGKLEPRDMDSLESIERSAKRLLTLVLDLVDLAKIESGSVSLVCSRVDVGAVVVTAVDHAKRNLASKPVDIEVKLPDELLVIECDQIKIDRVVSSLVCNAIQYTDYGVITVSLTKVDNGKGEPFVRISVKDTGIGIAREDQPHLFTRFTERAGEKHLASKGAGLGLPISVEFIHMHGGTIEVHSELGVGSEFVVTLPMKQGEAGAESGAGERVSVGV